MPAMKLFYSPGACSFASHVVLEETGAPYELVAVPVADRSNWKPEYLKVNPRGFVPALADEDWVMTENTAIMLYLAQRFPAAGLLPKAPQALAKALEWALWQTNTAHTALAMLWRSERFLENEAEFPALRATAVKRIRLQQAEIEAWFARHPFAAGDVFSIGDPMFLVLYRWGWRAKEPMNRNTFPHWTAYIERMVQRPSVRRALEQEKISLFE
jgi:glutathione S-transferase